MVRISTEEETGRAAAMSMSMMHLQGPGPCGCVPTRVTARSNSSSESLEGARASGKKGASARGERWWYHVLHRIRGGGRRAGQHNCKTTNVSSSSSSTGGGGGAGGLGTWSGVLIPTCENMWGVLIFLRFFYIVGSAGVWQTFLIVFVTFLCAMLTTMSLSAIATNGKIEQGGTYYIISRALGPKLGGAVGLLYFIGVVLLAVMEGLGSIEMLLFTFPKLAFPQATRVLGALVLLLLGTLVLLGIKFVSKLGLLFFALVLYTMLSFYLGLSLAPRGGDTHPPSLTGLSWTTFEGNWSPGYPPGKSFSTAVALFFPCFTGILSGADRATNLRRPEKSIPHGTLGAIVVSFAMYMSYMGLWAAVAQRDYLLGNTGFGEHAMLEVVRMVAYPVPMLTELGISMAAIAQAMQCLIISPRLLQAIAADGVVPFLGPFAVVSETGEPRRALLLTTALCLVFAMIGSLNAVAPLVSICFLTCYSALNLSCLVLSVVNAPSWRPKWKYYHWSAALLGFLACAAMNFVIVWYFALAAMVVLALLYAYIDYRQVEVNWGTGLGGLCLQIAVRGILSVGAEAQYTVNWRPQLLCLCKPRSSRTDKGHADHEFLFFASQLKKGQGLCVVTVILEGKLEEMAAQAVSEKIELESRMSEAKVTGFGRVLIANSYRQGKTYAIQSSGLGSLEPNTLVLGWPTKWRDEGHDDNAETLLETLSECRAVDKAVLLCMHLDLFPGKEEVQEGVIDVWWIVHDGGLLLLLAHLLQQHKMWRKCKLRVHTVAEKLDNSEVVKRNLERLLELVRIKAEVQVIELDESGWAPYALDHTIRAEDARAFTEEVAMYRKSNELGVTSPESSRRSGVTSKLGEKVVKETALSTSQLSELERVNQSRLHLQTSSSPSGGKGSHGLRILHPDVATQCKTTLSDGRSVEFENVIPGTISSPHKKKKPNKMTQNEADGGVEDAGPPLEIVIHECHQEIDAQDSAEDDESHPESAIPSSSQVYYPGSPAGNPAAPAASLHDPLRRTWASMSQSCTPQKLNAVIHEQSQGASLILINLPDHYDHHDCHDRHDHHDHQDRHDRHDHDDDDGIVVQPSCYMEYCEELCEGLGRVLLVHGTGKELWGSQAHLGL